MTLPSLRLGAAALMIAAAAAFATGCAAAPAPAPTEDAAAAPTTAPETPEPEVSAEPTTKPAADPTCDTLISSSTVDTFASVGWTSQQEPIWIGSQEAPDGILCRWGDFSTANEQMQMFGWAPLTAAEASAAQDELVASGWIREETPAGVYLTENPDTAFVTDDDGYGQTYLFTDGQVTFADTKQGLLLVEWPRS